MAAGTLKDFLIGVGFDVDSAGSAKAEAVLNNLNAIVKQLGQVLIATGNSVKGLIDSAASGAGSVEGLSEGLENTSGSAKNASKSLEQASQSSRIEGAKHGVKNVSSLDAEFKKVTRTVRRYAMVAVTALAGSNIKTAFKQTVEFMNGLATAAKDLNKSYEATRAYNTALKVMGKTAQEIEKDASLKETFNTLQSLGDQMALPQAAQGVTAIRDLMGMFTQLKFTANYALQWILYKIQTVAEGPLANVRDLLTGVRTWFGKNMEKIATAIATGVKYAIQIFINLGKTIGDIIGLIDKLPDSIKIVGAVALAVIGMVKSKTFLITAIITVILLLIDDLRTYLEGGDSLFGGFWGKCIEWAEKVKPVVEDVIKKVGDFITTIGKGTTKVVGWLSKVGLLGPLLGGIAVALAAIKAIKIAATIKKAYDSFNNFLGVIKLTNPKLLLIGIIVAAVAAAAIYLIQNWDKVKAVAEKVWTAVSEYVTQAWKDIKAAWGSVVTWFSGKWNRISQKVSEVWTNITSWVSGAWDDIKGAWDGAVAWFKGIWDGIKSGARNVYSSVVGFFKSAWNKVKGAWGSVAGFFTGIWDSITDGDGFKGLANKIITPFRNAWTRISSIFSNIKERVGTWFSGIGDKISGVVGNISAWAVNGWRKIVSTLSQAKDRVGNWFSGIGSKIAGVVGNVAEWATNAWETIKEKFANIKTTVSNWFSGIGTNVSMVVGNVAGWATTAWNTISGFFKNVVSKVSGWFKGLGGAVKNAVGDVAEWARNAWARIQNALAKVQEKVTGWFKGIGGKVSEVVGDVGAWATKAWRNISLKLKNAGTKISGWFKGISISKSVAKVSDWAANAWGTIRDQFVNIGTDIAGWFEDIDLTQAVEHIKSFFSGIGTWFEGIWRDVVNGLIDGLNWLIRKYNSVAGIFGDALTIGEISHIGEENEGSGESEGAAAHENLTTEEKNEKLKGLIDKLATAQATGDTESYKEVQQEIEALQQGIDNLAESDAPEEAAEKFEDFKAAVDETGLSLEELKEKYASGDMELDALDQQFLSLKDSIDSSMTESEQSVQSSVNAINASLNTIPSTKTIDVRIGAAGPAGNNKLVSQYSQGGKVYDRTNATIGENGPEYVIPLNKPNRAISLLKQAAHDLGMNLGSAQNAMNLIGGRPEANITPAYALPGGGGSAGGVTNNYNTINSPVTQNISGNNDQAIADMAAKDYERVILRNIKPILA